MTKEVTAPTSLSFPHATFAKLTPNAFLQAHLKHAGSIRPNGRRTDQFREVSVNAGSLVYSNGSAVVRLGDTAIVCGVRAEILSASDIPLPPRDDDTNLVQDLGLLVPNVELSTGCSPAHLPGNPPSSLAQSLSWRLNTLLHTTNLIDIGDLQIQHTQPAGEDDEAKIVTKAYWTLYLDILCISLDGNCLDAAWIALLAALRDTTLPQAGWDADREMVICSPARDHARTLHLSASPLTSTFAAFSAASPLRDVSQAEVWLLADPDTFEEEACSEFVTITVHENGITRIEKSGGSTINAQQLKQCVALAFERRQSVLNILHGR